MNRNRLCKACAVAALSAAIAVTSVTANGYFGPETSAVAATDDASLEAKVKALTAENEALLKQVTALNSGVLNKESNDYKAGYADGVVESGVLDQNSFIKSLSDENKALAAENERLKKLGAGNTANISTEPDNALVGTYSRNDNTKINSSMGKTNDNLSAANSKLIKENAALSKKVESLTAANSKISETNKTVVTKYKVLIDKYKDVKADNTDLTNELAERPDTPVAPTPTEKTETKTVYVKVKDPDSYNNGYKKGYEEGLEVGKKEAENRAEAEPLNPNQDEEKEDDPNESQNSQTGETLTPPSVQGQNTSQDPNASGMAVMINSDPNSDIPLSPEVPTGKNDDISTGSSVDPPNATIVKSTTENKGKGVGLVAPMMILVTIVGAVAFMFFKFKGTGLIPAFAGGSKANDLESDDSDDDDDDDEEG